MLKMLSAVKVLLALRAWLKSRTLATVGAGGTFFAVDATAFDGKLSHAALIALQTLFNHYSPVDLSEQQMGAAVLFIMSLVGAILHAHDNVEATQTTEG